MSDILNRARAHVSSIQGKSEFSVIEANEELKDIFNELQQLRTEMNEAKKKAAAEAAKPYQESIESLEVLYSTILKVSA